ncbi:uncharacterized protein LOC110011408 [Sesamum indicum]|uniref:Uncharacterized protein LOC110011408 n=1 Tax=Sesamum indicum TaxID=4182 RepID=A0A8M8UKC1_SESIN|nr:uncharacterized protein LOC110011408 [Sesamum indicum]
MLHPTNCEPNNHFHHINTSIHPSIVCVFATENDSDAPSISPNSSSLLQNQIKKVLVFFTPPPPGRGAMASSYKRLKNEINLLDEDHEDFDIREKVIGRISRRRFQVRRKLRVKIPNLKRLLRRKVKVVKVAWKKMYKRLKESQSHFGDLFAGNYLFMQVTPTPFKYALDHHHHNYVKTHQHDHDVHDFSSSGYSLPAPRVIN